MTDKIKAEALALVQEVKEGLVPPITTSIYVDKATHFEALCRAIEKLHAEREGHEAYKRKISDAIEAWNNAWRDRTPGRDEFIAHFRSFVLHKPVGPLDKLTEAIKDAFPGVTGAKSMAESIAEVILKRGGKIVWEGE